MSEINKINLNDTLFDIEDTVARENITTMQANIANDLDACSLVAKEDKSIAGAYAVQQLNNSLTADNAQAFQFAYDSESGKYGYKVKEADTDVFVPFSSGGLVTVTDSFSLTNPLLNVNGMNSNLGFVIYSLYPIDFTDIQSITYQFQYISYVSSNICISITDEQLTTSADIVANATLKIPFSASNSWVLTNVSTLDTSNISGKKYIGVSMENYTQSDFLNLAQFTLNKG